MSKDDPFGKKERVRLMLNALPISTQIWDRNINLIECNDACLKLFGYKEKQEFLDNFLSCCSPEFQPDGQHSAQKAVMLVNKAFDEGYDVFEWTHQSPADGTPIPAEITLVRAKYGSDVFLIGYTRDLREHYMMMEAIEHRDNLLLAVNKAAISLLNAEFDTYESVLKESMHMIAEAAKVDCVYLWENHTRDGNLHCRQLFEWSLKRTPFADGKLYRYSDVVPGWEETLSSGNYINAIVSRLSQEVRNHLEPSGILSVLVVPIFIKTSSGGSSASTIAIGSGFLPRRRNPSSTRRA